MVDLSAVSVKIQAVTVLCAYTSRLVICFVQTEIEQYAQENLNKHKKGLLGKAVPVTDMLSWTKVSFSVSSLWQLGWCNTSSSQTSTVA